MGLTDVIRVPLSRLTLWVVPPHCWIQCCFITLVNPLLCYEKNWISPFGYVLCHCLRMASIRKHHWCWVRIKKKTKWMSDLLGKKWEMTGLGMRTWGIGMCFIYCKSLINAHLALFVPLAEFHLYDPSHFPSPSNFPLHHHHLSLTAHHDPCTDSMLRLWQGVYTSWTVSTC